MTAMDDLPGLAPHLPALLPLLAGAASSPATAARADSLVYRLRKAVFSVEEEALGQLVAGVACQVLKPACPSQLGRPAWDKQQLQAGLARAVWALHSATVPGKVPGEEMGALCATYLVLVLY